MSTSRHGFAQIPPPKASVQSDTKQLKKAYLYIGNEKERNIENPMKAKIMKPTSEESTTLPRIQAYSKSQLATFYLPHIQPASARRTLRSWIAKNTALQNALARTGYSDKAILLTPAQVGLIFRFLGEP